MIFFLLAAMPAFALELKMPSVFCEHGEQVVTRVSDCGANGQFSQAAAACIQKIEALERELGKKAQAIAEASVGSQQGKVSAGQSGYAYSTEALRYLYGVAGLALLELKEYPRYVVTPGDFLGNHGMDPFERIDRMECFGGVQRQIQAEIQSLQAKQARFLARRSEAQGMENSLRQSSGKLEGKSGSVLGGARVSGPGAKGKDQNKSNVSGELTPKK